VSHAVNSQLYHGEGESGSNANDHISTFVIDGAEYSAFCCWFNQS